ncbi:MAG: PAS domain-containing protein [Bacteroidales bacterium]|nr:PAS domain-containing protein [Bacteroidales bacterium]
MKSRDHLHSHNELPGMLDLIIPAAFDEISEIVSVKSPDHTILFYNRAGYKMLGLEPEDVIGRKCYEIIGCPTFCSNCAGARVVITKKSDRAESYFESIGKWFEINAMPVCNKEGKVIFVLEILRDITNLKKLEEQIAKYEAQEVPTSRQ